MSDVIADALALWGRSLPMLDIASPTPRSPAALQRSRARVPIVGLLQICCMTRLK
jgi:hypothetical protein